MLDKKGLDENQGVVFIFDTC